MPVCVYALVAGARPRLGKGAAAEPLRPIRGKKLSAIAGNVRSAPKPSEEKLRAHDRVVRRLFASHDPLLPVRFGTTFADDEEVAQMLADRGAILASALGRVRGGIQITLRIFSDSPLPAAKPSQKGGPGTRFLSVRRAAAAPPKLLAPLLRTLQPFVLETRVEPHEAAPLRTSIHQLVRRGDTDEYLQTLQQQALPRGVTIRIAGPFPPWAFAETT